LSIASAGKHYWPLMVLVNYRSRIINIRTVLVIVICGAAWALLPVRDIVTTPRVVFDNHDQHRHLPPAFVVNSSCKDAQPPANPTELSQTLFPVSNPENNRSWVGENHKMLQALFRCIELSNCGPNQKKVVILDSFQFRLELTGSTGGENIWARSTVQISVLGIHDAIADV